jgi:hypothetical protein
MTNLLSAVQQAINDNTGREYDSSYYQKGLSATCKRGVWDVALHSEPMTMIVISSDDERGKSAETLAQMIAEAWEDEWTE